MEYKKIQQVSRKIYELLVEEKLSYDEAELVLNFALENLSTIAKLELSS